jgi:hypothetical protein
VQLRGGPPPAGEIPFGCRFHPRCPRYLGEICATVEPPWLSATDENADSGTNGLHTEPRRTAGVAEHATRCHIPHAELLRLQVLPSTDESAG